MVPLLVPIVIVLVEAAPDVASGSVVVVVVAEQFGYATAVASVRAPAPLAIEEVHDNVEHGEILLCGPGNKKPRPHPYG